MPRSPGRQRGKKAPSEKTGGSAWYKKITAEIRDRLIRIDKKKVFVVNIPYVIVLFLNFGLAFKNPLPSLHLQDFMIGIAGAALLKLMIYYKGKNAKKFR